MRNTKIIVWNGLIPSPKLASAAIKQAPVGQHVLHTIKGTYVLSKDGEWKCVRGATNIADLIRAAHKKSIVTKKKVDVKTKPVVVKKKRPMETTKPVVVKKKLTQMTTVTKKRKLFKQDAQCSRP